MAAAKSDWTGALEVGGFALGTAWYNDNLRRQGRDANGAAILEGLLSFVALGASAGQGFIANGAAGVLGGALATIVMKG